MKRRLLQFDKKLFVDLYDAHVIKVGSFRLRIGEREPYRYVTTPFLVDVRVLISYPTLLQRVAKAYENVLQKLHFDRMAAIPYAALPIVVALSLVNKKPWIYPRKEVKQYGTQKVIEGEFCDGDTVVIVDDTLTSGSSVLLAVEKLKQAGLVVHDVVLLIDRGEIGTSRLEANGLRVISLYHINDILQELFLRGKISKEQYDLIQVGHEVLKASVIKEQSHV